MNVPLYDSYDPFLFMNIQTYELFGVPLIDWLIVLGGGSGLAFLLVIIRGIVSRRFKKLADRTSNVIDDLISLLVRKTKGYTLLAFSIGLALWIWPLPEDAPEHVADILHRAIFLIFLYQVGVWGNSAISWWVDYYQKQRISEDPGSVTTIRGIAILAVIVLWLTLLLVTLDNFGIDVTALVTGLGIGGIAVALAVQNILGDLFASLSIMLDKPFVIGDFLIVGDFMGTVEDIGLKTTRLRSLSGEQIVMSNSDLLQSRIRNYKRMYERRIVFSVGVEYETSEDKLPGVVSILKEAVEAQNEVRFDRAHFKSFGDFALVYEVVYHVLKPDYNLYMDIQQAINLRIVREFAREDIQIAYPTQKLFVHSTEPVAPNGSQPAKPHEAG